jgi:hypothetical protein
LQEHINALAEKAIGYYKMQIMSADYLRTDVSRRDAMLRSLSTDEAPNILPMRSINQFGVGNELDLLLAKYDEILRKESLTFEE